MKTGTSSARSMVDRDDSRLVRLRAANSKVYAEVEDNRSPVTLFAFAGAAGRIGLIPPFEFRRYLREAGSTYNFVFFRDIHRATYHLTPDGKTGGLEFWLAKTDELRRSLGSTHHVALGTSIGAGVALYVGALARLNQVLAFGPVFLHPAHGTVWHQARTFANLAMLVRSPANYFETTAMTSIHVLVYRYVCRAVGQNHVQRLYDVYEEGRPLPEAVVFYSQGSGYDRPQVRLIAGRPRIELVPVSTAHHNCAGYLRRQGTLVSTIIGRIEGGRPKPGPCSTR